MFSIITPYYNSHEYLEKGFDGLIGQTTDDWEWIIVDDGSKQKSLDWLQELASKDKRITVVSQKNAGQGAARNKGAAASKGDYICFLDSDDWFAPEKLAKQREKLDTTQSDFCFTATEGVREDGCKEFFSGEAQFDVAEGNEILSKLIDTCFFTLSSVMITRSCFDELKGFSPEPQFRATEDYDLWIRAAAANKKFCFVDEPLTCYCIREDSEVRDLIRGYNGTLLAIEPLLDHPSGEIRESARKRTNFLAKRLICRSLAYGKMDIATRWREKHPHCVSSFMGVLFWFNGILGKVLLSSLYRIKTLLK